MPVLLAQFFLARQLSRSVGFCSNIMTEEKLYAEQLAAVAVLGDRIVASLGSRITSRGYA